MSDFPCFIFYIIFSDPGVAPMSNCYYAFPFEQDAYAVYKDNSGRFYSNRLIFALYLYWLIYTEQSSVSTIDFVGRNNDGGSS